MPALKRYARHQFAVYYRRRGWTHHLTRYFQSRRGALKLVKKLLAGGGTLAPLAEATVERRELGPVERVWELQFEEPPR